MTDIEIQKLAKEYADRFDIDNGDLPSEFVEMASLEVYPSSLSVVGLAKSRQEFRIAVLREIRERQHNAKRRLLSSRR